MCVRPIHGMYTKGDLQILRLAGLVKLTICDTLGFDDLDALRQRMYSESQVALMYPDSLENVQKKVRDNASSIDR